MLMEYLPWILFAATGIALVVTLGALGGQADKNEVLGQRAADYQRRHGILQNERDKLRSRLDAAHEELSKAARVSAKCEAIVEPNKRGTFYWHIDFDGKTRASSTHKTFKTPAEPRMLLESMFPGIKVKVVK